MAKVNKQSSKFDVSSAQKEIGEEVRAKMREVEDAGFPVRSACSVSLIPMDATRLGETQIGILVDPTKKQIMKKLDVKALQTLSLIENAVAVFEGDSESKKPVNQMATDMLKEYALLGDPAILEIQVRGDVMVMGKDTYETMFEDDEAYASWAAEKTVNKLLSGKGDLGEMLDKLLESMSTGNKK